MNISKKTPTGTGTGTGIGKPPEATPPKSPTSPPPNPASAGSEARLDWSPLAAAAIRQAIVISPSPAATPDPSVPIPSLEEAKAFVNAQDSLSTEDLFKTLLVYYKPDLVWFETPSDLPSITAAINKGASSQGTVSEETQKNISEAIMSSQSDSPLLTEVALAIATNLGAFTDPDAQRYISFAILDRKFGSPIPEEVALAIATKLDTFKDRAAQKNISLAIYREQFGDPTIPPAVALAIAAKFDTFTYPLAQRDIVLAICNGVFGNPTIPPEVALGIATKLDMFKEEAAQQNISEAIYREKFGDPIPQEVALAIATKLDTFTDPDAQKYLSLAIRNGIFGAPISTAVAIAIAANLGTFTDPDAQQNIALALRFSILTSEAIPQAIQTILESLTDVTISQDIYSKKFGTPIPTAVALAIATKLGTFKDRAAQKNISLAIRNGIFGAPIQQEVALAIATKLDTFTDRGAQQCIAMAILEGKFGNPIRDEVALAIAAKLDTFKEEAAQKDISEAIRNGRFGNPNIPPEVALAIAAKLGTFKDRAAQKNISLAIRNGIFGAPIQQEVALAIAAKFDTFTAPEAQENISAAIRSRVFGNPTIPQKVALAIATKLGTFTAPEAQKYLSLAICSGRFGDRIPSEVALAIAAKFDTFKEEDAQENISAAICNGVFGNPTIPEDVALDIAAKLDTFTDQVAQRYISEAILLGRFGEPIRQDVALALVSKLDTFTAPVAQRNIASAIFDGKFGTPIRPDVALAIAAKLDTFTAPEAQRDIALALRFSILTKGSAGIPQAIQTILESLTDVTISRDILNWKLGTQMPQAVALAIATNLDMFEDPVAQRNISDAIYNGRFGTTLQTLPPEGKAAIMSFLKKVSLSDAIENFDRLSAWIGESPEFKQSALQAVALPSVRAYTEAETVLQQYEAVKNLATGVAKFNCDAPPRTLPTTFSSIARNLATVLSSPPADIATCFPGFQALIDRTQQFKGLIESLGDAIEKKQALSGDSATEAAKLAASQRITDSAEAVKAFPRTAPEFTDLGTLEATITTAAAKLAHLKPSLASELASQLRPVPFGAQIVPMTSQTIAHLNGLAQVDLTDIFGDNQEMAYLLYGTQDAQQSERPGAAATDATAKRPKLLLTYDCSTPAAREAFQGWLSDYSVLYKATVQNVNVYDVSGASPVRLDIRDARHTSFPDLPLFMCKAITDCSFDITAYRHRDELDLIFGEAGILPMLRSQHAADPAKLALIDKMQSIIQTCIAQEGNSVSIAASTADDQALKDAMNQLCTSDIETMAPFIEKLTQFLAIKEQPTCARLAFLFGQLAKKGVLGYHHGSNNTANDLFYKLSEKCFQKLSSQTLPESDRQKLLRDLGVGSCIEVITNSFLTKHRAVAGIWQRH